MAMSKWSIIFSSYQNRLPKIWSSRRLLPTWQDVVKYRLC